MPDLRHPVLAAAILLGLAAGHARAEEAAAESAAPTLPGLPSGLTWTFNFDASVGTFGFADSLYTDPKPEQPSGDLSDNWSEASVKPALSAEYTTSSSSQIYGKFSAVGTRTFGAAPTLVGDDASSFDIEDAYVGWRSGNSLGDLGENVLDFTVGRAQYTLGHGMVLYDGSADGGSRGGYWTGARKAFEFAAIGRFKPGNHTFEAFYLDKDDMPEADSDSKLWGANYEYAIGEDTTLGATYMKWSADERRSAAAGWTRRLQPARLHGTLPGPQAALVRGRVREGRQRRRARLGGLERTGRLAVQLGLAAQAFLPLRHLRGRRSGDGPRTKPLTDCFTGFHDWGTWWQGEIAGEYFVSNSNLISHQLRVDATPTDAISTGLILYDFQLDKPASLGPQVTSDEVAYELDWYMEWSVNDNFSLSFVAAIRGPRRCHRAVVRARRILSFTA